MTTSPRPTCVIVGAGLAGATAAQTLRSEGFDGDIVLIGEESQRPYERPPLSKDLLLGTAETESVFVHPEGWYAENAVDLRTGTTVVGVDRKAHRVLLDTGAPVGYDSLLLTTGSAPRRLAVPGADLAGVLYLRRLDDSLALRSAFARGPRVVVVGGGWIGLEAAAAARSAGLDVTVLEQFELPLLRVLGPDVARVFADLHRDHKVDLRCGVEVASLVGADGRVTGVRLGDGSTLPADLVLVGVGITPNVALAEDAGLAVANGVVVDQHLRTEDPDVYAAGDVASAYHPTFLRHLRVEHWANARRQGAEAARSMLGRGSGYDRVPYFFTDQYDVGMEYAGYVEPGAFDRVVYRGDVAGRHFVTFWPGAGRVLAGMAVNTWDVVGDIERLVASGRRVDLARLADDSVPLAEV